MVSRESGARGDKPRPMFGGNVTVRLDAVNDYIVADVVGRADPHSNRSSRSLGEGESEGIGLVGAGRARRLAQDRLPRWQSFDQLRASASEICGLALAVLGTPSRFDERSASP